MLLYRHQGHDLAWRCPRWCGSCRHQRAAADVRGVVPRCSEFSGFGFDIGRFAKSTVQVGPRWGLGPRSKRISGNQGYSARRPHQKKEKDAKREMGISYDSPKWYNEKVQNRG